MKDHTNLRGPPISRDHTRNTATHAPQQQQQHQQQNSNLNERQLQQQNYNTKTI